MLTPVPNKPTKHKHSNTSLKSENPPLRLLLRRLRLLVDSAAALRSTRLRLSVVVATPRLNARTLAAAESVDRRRPSPKTPLLPLPKSLPGLLRTRASSRSRRPTTPGRGAPSRQPRTRGPRRSSGGRSSLTPSSSSGSSRRSSRPGTCPPRRSSPGPASPSGSPPPTRRGFVESADVQSPGLQACHCWR